MLGAQEERDDQRAADPAEGDRADAQLAEEVSGGQRQEQGQLGVVADHAHGASAPGGSGQNGGNVHERELSGFPSPVDGAAPGPCTQEKGQSIFFFFFLVGCFLFFLYFSFLKLYDHPPRLREDQPASGSGRKSAGGSTPSRAARAYQWALDRGVRTCVS
ncbi:predicted protein [Streptomyces albidoflavus]|nr:predicted protein [Streptomyces albidoflavus]